MAMPVKAFWKMLEMVNRIDSEADMRKLSVALHAQSGEGAKEYRKSLEKTMGEVIKKKEVLDLGGWNMLKKLQG